MKVTLYKNVKLNNKYKDVFYNKTYLEAYLSNLSSVVVLNDDETYSRNGDALWIDGINIQNFKEYNYLKIEDTIGTFYAFINDIEWVSETYKIYYEEDVMSNYFEHAHIRNSLLTGNKSLKLYKGNDEKNINYYKLPIEPAGNNYINFNSFIIDNIEENETLQLSILVKIQTYKLTQAGEEGEQRERKPRVGIFTFEDASQGIPTLYKYDWQKSACLDFITMIINNANNFEVDADTYYEIDKIYVVPSQYIDINDSSFISTSFLHIGGSAPYRYGLRFYDIDENNYTALIKTTINTINYDFNIDSIGLLTLPIKVVNNGTNINIKLDFFQLGYDIKFILNIQNKIIDISQQFEVDVPFYQLNASSVQLQRMQKELSENSLYNSIANSKEEVNRSLTNLAIGSLSGFANGIAGSVTGNAPLAITGFSSAVKSATDNYSNMIIAENNIFYAKEKINLINKAMYSNSSIKVNNFSLINSVLGIGVFTISPDNETQINQAIKLSGYLVRELVGDIIQELDIENLTDHYDVFKFDEVNVYGIISQNYVKIIENILLNGVRVWCQNDIGELV